MTNDVIREAFIQEAQERCIGYYNQAAKHRFSLGYIINRRKIIKGYEKSLEKRMRSSEKPLRLKPVFRLNLIIIAVLLAVLASAAFAIYTIINGFSFRTHPTHSVVEYLEIEAGKTSIEEEYYIPETEGLTIVNNERISDAIFIQYEYRSNVITFEQRTVDRMFNVNTEGAKIDKIDINGNSGFFVDKDDIAYICWVQDGYIFSISGKINNDEAENLAKSTKIK